jgi:ketosteroid isomerase-like protein
MNEDHIDASRIYTLPTRGSGMAGEAASNSRTWNRTTTTLLACTLALCTVISTHAQTTADPLHKASRQELDVIKVILAQEKAWNAGDLPGYVKGYKDSPDTLFIGKQVSKGYAEIFAEYRHDYPTTASMGTLGFSELEVHPLSETFAVCIGRFHLDRSKREGGSADGVFSLVFEKTEQGWKIVVDHTT